MKISFIALGVALAGIAWMILAGVRWFWLYPDYSQFLLSMAIGLGVLYAAYFYNWAKDVDLRFKAQEHRIDIITEQVFKIKPKDKI